LEEGDIITQTVRIQILEDTTADSYEIQVGLYSEQSWERIDARSAGFLQRKDCFQGAAEI